VHLGAPIGRGPQEHAGAAADLEHAQALGDAHAPDRLFVGGELLQLVRLPVPGACSPRASPTRERTVYTLTDKGLRALKGYARTPVTFTPLKSEPLLRLLIADLVGEQPTRESLATLRADIAELELQLDDAEQTAELLPHRRKYLLMVIAFLRRLFELHLELVDEVERELT
jgi:DNA-binding PadR family transcriptional regulator